MNKEILLDNDVVTLWYYPESKIIHHQFHKFIYGEKFQEVMLKGLEYFEKEKCSKWLSDDRKNSALRKADLEWGNTYWRSRMIAAGWKYWAIMIPDLTVGKMSMMHLIDDYKKDKIEVEIFEDVELALKWLQKK
jgi:hypothetical protein